MWRQAGVFLCLLLGLVGFASEAFAGRRIALLIGNAAYVNAPLLNPANDVAAMKAALSAAGFDIVDDHTNLDRADMIKALRSFEDAVQGADIGVVFYSGHGIEFNGQNYLIPTDAKLASDLDVDDEAINLDRVLRSLEGATRLKLVLLDACRENPFLAGMKRFVTKGAGSKGLGRTEASDTNMLIAYAAAPGQVALDGDGLNSPFTTALVKHLTVPGLDVELALRQARDDVVTATDRRQVPFKTGSIGGGVITLGPVAPRDDPPHTTSGEVANLMAFIGGQSDRGVLGQFLTYPDSTVQQAARQRLAALPVEDQRSAAAIATCDRLAALQEDPTRPAGITGNFFLSLKNTHKIQWFKAVQACRIAVEARFDDPRMKLQLAVSLLFEDLPEARTEAMSLLRQATAAGSLMAQTILGMTLALDSGGIKADPAEAERLVRDAAQKNISLAQYILGVAYSFGYGNIKQDESESLLWMRKAADGGMPDAMGWIGQKYFDGDEKNHIVKDEAEGIRWLTRAAETGEDRSAKELGDFYHIGRVVPQDDAEAFRWYKQSVEAGNVYAKVPLGNLLLDGKGTPADPAAAFHLFSEAATDPGDNVAMERLAHVYETGIGVRQDMDLAEVWYKKAGEIGNVDAMKRLGSLYEEGTGLTHSLANARLWYGKAADQGDKEAQTALARLQTKAKDKRSNPP